MENPEGGAAYYLFESNGVVVSCGGAPLDGSTAGAARRAPIVGGEATTSSAGYWLAGANGSVYPFGSAAFFGSAVHLRLRSPIVGFAATPNGQGYWLIEENGSLFHFGNAGFFGSTVHDRHDGAVIALLPTPDGEGYWVVSADGKVRNFGDAPPVGSLAHRRPPVVAAAAEPDGRGLLLLTRDGGVHPLGTATYRGSLVHHHLARPVTSMSVTSDGGGYILGTASGSVYPFGDATFEGSIAAHPPRRPAGVVATSMVNLPSPLPSATLTAVSTTSNAIVPAGSFGYDVSSYQCSSPGASSASTSLPASAPFAVIQAAGWLDNSSNSCLAAEAAWATTAAGAGGAHYSLYLFVNAPNTSAAANALDASGPAGTCSTLSGVAEESCVAYNYGYNGALAVERNSQSVGVSSSLWWLDVEGTNLSPSEWSNYAAGEYWSSQTALNDATLQGAIDALRSVGATVGIYSDSVQFPTIAGSFVPSGAQVPLWVAGAPWTNPPYQEDGLTDPSALVGWCTGTSGYSSTAPSDLFAGGTVWLLQETPGSEASPYGIDPDYSC